MIDPQVHDFKPGQVCRATHKGRSVTAVFAPEDDSGLHDYFYVFPDAENGGTWASTKSLRDIEPLTVIYLGRKPMREELGAVRSEAQRFVDMLTEAADNFFDQDAAYLANAVAGQIAEQIKPPRIAEPGLYGVVEAGHRHLKKLGDGRGTFVRFALEGRAQWVETRGEADWCIWEDLIDPVEKRPGIEKS